jgi:Glycosyltransferase family 9 (heptosyltransferase)
LNLLVVWTAVVVLYGLADVLVTNDSGPAHFASLTTIHTVVLFGPETPHLFAATTKRSKPIWAGIVCSPCVSALNNRRSSCRDNVCMQRISVDRVFAAVCDSYEEHARSFGANSGHAYRIRLFNQVFTLVPLSVFVIFGITHRVKLNWTGPLWLAVIPAVAAHLTAAPSVLTRRAWMTTLALACVVYPAFLIYLSFGLPSLGFSAKMELLPVGWSEMGSALEGLKREVQE